MVGDTITRAALRAALLRWDRVKGAYPEDEWQGFAFWDWLERGMPDWNTPNLGHDPTKPYGQDTRERESAWQKELAALYDAKEPA